MIHELYCVVDINMMKLNTCYPTFEEATKQLHRMVKSYPSARDIYSIFKYTKEDIPLDREDAITYLIESEAGFVTESEIMPPVGWMWITDGVGDIALVDETSDGPAIEAVHLLRRLYEERSSRDKERS